MIAYPGIKCNEYRNHRKGGDNVRKKGTFEDPKIKTDPLGSYTGRPENTGEKPVQDADDL